LGKWKFYARCKAKLVMTQAGSEVAFAIDCFFITQAAMANVNQKVNHIFMEGIEHLYAVFARSKGIIPLVLTGWWCYQCTYTGAETSFVHQILCNSIF